MANGPVQIPQAARLKLCRAAVQVIADRAGCDILHIKGDAVSPSLREVTEPGTDVDVLVRPAHVEPLHTELVQRGWRVYSSFAFGSPFGHAQTYVHDQWGYLDLHRLFPGIERTPADAFQLLWTARVALDIAGIAGWAPAVAAQATILLLNSARSPRPSDVERLWTNATPSDKAAVRDHVERLHAEVAFAAATGSLDAHRAARSYPLWRVLSQGGTRAEEWRARILAAPGARERMLLILRAPAVNTEQLAHRLGRRPNRREIAQAFVARPLMAVQQWRAARRQR